MSPADRYLHDVLSHVPAAFPEHRARIAADLRSHLAESVEAGGGTVRSGCEEGIGGAGGAAV